MTDFIESLIMLFRFLEQVIIIKYRKRKLSTKAISNIVLFESVSFAKFI